MKIKQFLIFVTFVFSVSLFSCKQLTEDEQFLRIAEKKHNNIIYQINSKIEGNFTNSGKREILVNFDTVYKNARKNVYASSMVFIINEQGKIEQSYDLYFEKDQSDKRRNFIKEIDLFEVTYKNTVITDFNKNGKLEFIYYVAEGSVFPFYIEEFKDGEFKHICQVYDGKLNTPGLDNYDLTHFDFENKAMYLSQRGTNIKIKLTWNSETEFYEKEVLQE